MRHTLTLVATWCALLQGVEKGAQAGYAKEAAEFGRLGMTPVSESLRGIFFGHQKCTKNPFGKPTRDAEVRVWPFGGALRHAMQCCRLLLPQGVSLTALWMCQTVGVLGAGLMGAGIAQVRSGCAADLPAPLSQLSPSLSCARLIVAVAFPALCCAFRVPTGQRPEGFQRGAQGHEPRWSVSWRAADRRQAGEWGCSPCAALRTCVQDVTIHVVLFA